MTRLQSPKYLVKRGDFFYFRLAIPTSLRRRFGWAELKASLLTEDRRIASMRCRVLANQFESLFATLPMMPELTQPQLQDIARSYFRKLLVQGNEVLFLALEDVAADDVATELPQHLAYLSTREGEIKAGHLSSASNAHYASKVDAALTENGLGHLTFGNDSHGILRDYFYCAELEHYRILRAKFAKDFPETLPKDPLYLGILDDIGPINSSLPPRYTPGDLIRLAAAHSRLKSKKMALLHKAVVSGCSHGMFKNMSWPIYEKAADMILDVYPNVTKVEMARALVDLPKFYRLGGHEQIMPYSYETLLKKLRGRTSGNPGRRPKTEEIDIQIAAIAEAMSLK